MIEFITDVRMYQAGLLRIAMKMRSDKAPFEACFKEITRELRLDPQGFRTYVNQNFSEVVATVKTSGKRIYWEL